MTVRVLSSLLVILIALAPVLRAACEADCTDRAAAVATPRCGSHEETRDSSPARGVCDHDHTSAAATSTIKPATVTPTLTDVYKVHTVSMTSARQVASVQDAFGNGPPLLYQTPLRI